MSASTAGAPKGPARPAAEILADIEKERVALGAAFVTLRAGIDESLDAGRRRAREAGRKAAVIGPLAGAALASGVAARLLWRRRRVRKKR